MLVVEWAGVLSFPLPGWVEDHDGLMSIRFSNVFPTVTLLLQAGNKTFERGVAEVP
jgi:hypothetical protein